MRTEAKEMVKVGEIIPCIIPNGKIASWKRYDDDKIFTKISKDYSTHPRWTAVENPNYRNKGLVVFLDRRPGENEVIRIVKTGENYAVGVVESGHLK